MDGLYAHTPNSDGDWHKLIDHTLGTASGARDRAAVFSEEAGDLAYLVGLLHDLGKGNPKFQRYLHACSVGRPASKTRHAIWGAARAYQTLGLLTRARDPEGWAWKQLALPILGHHGGLKHGGEISQELQAFVNESPEALALAGELFQTLPPVGRFPRVRREGTSGELFIRMLFSALVDADYADTERHFHPERSAARESWPSVETLVERFRVNQAAFVAGALARGGETEVNRVRQEVLAACNEKASSPTGVYRLTVPTGGGKTRSGMAFALEHARARGLRRVVVAIPYTSIIDQNAREYRKMLGEDAVLEHHSQVPIPADGDEDQSPEALSQRLATEDWSTPVVVTTTVQLFESLFSNRPARVGKRHNLARSVILLDEVQTLPPALLQPTVDALRLLVDEYGCTLVLSTATQPALEESTYLQAFGGVEVHEIVESCAEHFERLRRVRYDVRTEPIDWPALAGEVGGRRQVMAVLNSRRDAIWLLKELDDQNVSDVVHLSTLLCGKHRARVLDEVRAKLADPKKPAIRLISTQVVEAGVDLDFPSVFRAVGPLDRISQAAGRCNREGKLGREGGEVIVFQLANGHAPTGPYGTGIAVSAAMLADLDNEKLHQPETFRDYFARLLSTLGPEELDKWHIQDARLALDYPQVAKDYRLIEETVPIVVDYEDANRLLDGWQRERSREAWRRLQPYLVSVRKSEAERLQKAGTISDEGNGLYFCPEYDERLGLAQAMFDPADLDTCKIG